MQGIPVQKLLVALNTHLAPRFPLRIIFWVRPRLGDALSAVGLSTKLAKLELLKGCHGGAASIAHEIAASFIGLSDYLLLLLV